MSSMPLVHYYFILLNFYEEHVKTEVSFIIELKSKDFCATFQCLENIKILIMNVAETCTLPHQKGSMPVF